MSDQPRRRESLASIVFVMIAYPSQICCRGAQEWADFVAEASDTLVINVIRWQLARWGILSSSEFLEEG